MWKLEGCCWALIQRHVCHALGTPNLLEGIQQKSKSILIVQPICLESCSKCAQEASSCGSQFASSSALRALTNRADMQQNLGVGWRVGALFAGILIANGI